MRPGCSSLLLLTLAVGAVAGDLRPSVNGTTQTLSGLTLSGLAPQEVLWTGAGGQVLGTSTLAYTSGGNVGIGTANPATLVHASSGTLLLDGNTPAINIKGVQSTTDPFVVGASTFIIKANGNVGIGIPAADTPSTLLHLSSGVLTIDGNGNPGIVVAKLVSNGELVLSTAPTPGQVGVKNIDVNTSGQTTFTPNLSSNTVSAALSGTFTNTTLGACVASSTGSLQLPTGNSLVLVGMNGAVTSSVINSTVTIAVIVDGAFTQGATATKGNWSTGVSGAALTAGGDMMLSGSLLITGLSAAAHNFCLSLAITSGTGTIESTKSNALFWAYALP